MYNITNNRLKGIIIERYLTAEEALDFINEALHQNFTDVETAIVRTRNSIYSVVKG